MTKQTTCKNTICVNNKTIKLGTMKAKKRIQLQRKQHLKKLFKNSKTRKITRKKLWVDSRLSKEKIYFYNIDEKTSYSTDKKSTWTHNKDKEGFLYLAEYRNFIFEHYKNITSEKPDKYFNRMVGPSIMIFYETDKKEIMSDPYWTDEVGITIKKPYSFGLSQKMALSKSYLQLTNQMIDKPITKKNKLSLSDFNEFVKKKEEELQEKDLLKEFKFANPYISTYSDLLHCFYKKSSFGDHNIFGIVRWA